MACPDSVKGARELEDQENMPDLARLWEIDLELEEISSRLSRLRADLERPGDSPGFHEDNLRDLGSKSLGSEQNQILNQKDTAPSAFGDRFGPMLFYAGLSVFVCGATLVGWGMLGSRFALSLWGVPLAVVGVATVIAALFAKLPGRAF